MAGAVIAPAATGPGHAERGLSLVEVLVSLGVLAFVSLSLMSMLTTSMKLDALAEQRSIATALATERLAQIGAMKFQDDLTYTNYKLPEETVDAGPPRRFVTAYGGIPSHPTYRREVVLVYDDPVPGMLSVRATVAWQAPGQPEREHTMITFLHPALEK